MVEILMPRGGRRYSAEQIYRMSMGAMQEMSQELAEEAGISELNALAYVLGAGALIAHKSVGGGAKTRDYLRALAEAVDAPPAQQDAAMERVNNAMRALCDGVD